MPIEALLIAAAVLAAGGAIVAGTLAVRGRSGSRDSDATIRRRPSPSSLGLADDPIVAAIGVDGERRRRVRQADPDPRD